MGIVATSSHSYWEPLANTTECSCDGWFYVQSYNMPYQFNNTLKSNNFDFIPNYSEIVDRCAKPVL